ncbi:GCG_CRPN prefix-to-repeats domain-containing protein [Rhizobium sp. BT03]|uniref:GCG_CRPN prefix-to-repeats domain-containing protein n=1 Tax=Rhizobium sp. BT03 TaxID=3045156 RepID=UPI0024B3DD86|nr:hypothetical protein [Rhizobium sp. BT03]WHO75111.1 hypothetical protein QMO80_004203 [Rhizobium sp. BT03]
MKALSIAAALLAGSLSIGTAEAMPMGAINVQSNVTSDVTKVDYACGRGWHLNRWGECRRNWRRPPPVAFYGGPPRWGWERRHRDWDGPRWRDERRGEYRRRWRDDY